MPVSSVSDAPPSIQELDDAPLTLAQVNLILEWYDDMKPSEEAGHVESAMARAVTRFKREHRVSGGRWVAVEKFQPTVSDVHTPGADGGASDSEVRRLLLALLEELRRKGFDVDGVLKAAPDWRVGTARDLPLRSLGRAWDGAAAKKRVFAWAGFDGENPRPTAARKAFLAYDAANPELQGSYKLPVADVVDGQLVAAREALGPAAQRLPQANLPPAVKERARAVLDGYYARAEKVDERWIGAVAKAGETGVMVGFFLRPSDAAKLALPGGEEAEDLHLTLAYLGDASEVGEGDVGKARRVVQEFARASRPIKGKVSGVGWFEDAGGEGKTACYASFDSPALPEFRQELVEKLREAGVSHSQQHGFTPHITLKYAEKGKAPDVPLLELEFRGITFAAGGVRDTFPLGREVDDRVTKEWVVPIAKADDELHLVYGVVLRPNVPDTQGDVYSAEEVRKAAHRYLVDSRKYDLHHEEEVDPSRVRVVESFVAPQRMFGGHVLKDDWVVVSHVPDDDMWARVKGDEVNAYSIRGWGRRKELDTAS